MNVTPLEYAAMQLVDKHEALTVGELQQLLGCTEHAIDRAVRSLVANGQAVMQAAEVVTTWGGIVPDGLRTDW